MAIFWNKNLVSNQLFQGRGVLLGCGETRVRSLSYLFSSILEWILKPVVIKEQIHGIGKLITLWCLLSLLVCFLAHGTPAAASLVLTEDAAGSKLLCCSAPSPLWMLPGQALVNTPDFVPLWNEKTSCNTGKRLVRQETYFLFCTGVCLPARDLSGAAPFLLMENQTCSFIPLGLADLLSCLK